MLRHNVHVHSVSHELKNQTLIKQNISQVNNNVGNELAVYN